MHSARDIVNLSPVIPVIRVEAGHDPVALGQALLAGGVNVMEITLRTDAAWAAIERLCNRFPEMTVGVGTVTRPAEIARARDAGAHFVVSPGCNQTLMAAASGAGMPFLPGIMTPSEVMTAKSAGLDTLKLFPAQPAGGVKLLEALSGPFPDVVFCPTGGIGIEEMPSYLALDNVACVGGSWLTPATALNKADWHVIEDLTRRAVAAGRPHKEAP